MPFNPIFKPFDTKPTAQSLVSETASFFSLLRDQFTLTTWIMIGAFLQGLLCLLPYRNLTLIAPVCLYVGYHSTVTILQSLGVLRNPYLDHVIPGHTAPVLPSLTTGTQDAPGGRSVCTLHISARSNHPLGAFAPGFKEVGDYFARMNADLDAHATAAGFLGSSSWLGAGDRGSKSELMNIMYFRTAEDVQRYAHGPMHTGALQWWSRHAKGWPHVALMHEIFAAPENGWEAIYVNYQPTGLGATATEVEVGGKKVWVNPLVQIKGPLRYSKGRMGASYDVKEEWPALEEVIVTRGYDDEKN